MGFIINPYAFGAAYDSDAQTFFTAAGITDTTQKTAVNQLVLDLKGYGIWTKMKSIYPFVGGTATTHKYNLKDPRDLDAAFRLVFNGGWTHSANGILPNGTNAYADTFLVESNVLALNSAHVSIYSRTNSTGLKCDVGGSGPSAQTNIFPNYSNTFYPRIQDINSGTSLNSDTRAMYMANRVSSSEAQGWRNSTKYTITSNSLGRNNLSYYLSAFNSGGYYSDRELAFATIGDGLTDTEVSNFYTVVQAFQTTLGRNI